MEIRIVGNADIPSPPCHVAAIRRCHSGGPI